MQWLGASTSFVSDRLLWPFLSGVVVVQGFWVSFFAMRSEPECSSDTCLTHERLLGVMLSVMMPILFLPMVLYVRTADVGVIEYQLQTAMDKRHREASAAKANTLLDSVTRMRRDGARGRVLRIVAWSYLQCAVFVMLAGLICEQVIVTVVFGQGADAFVYVTAVFVAVAGCSYLAVFLHTVPFAVVEQLNICIQQLVVLTRVLLDYFDNSPDGHLAGIDDDGNTPESHRPVCDVELLQRLLTWWYLRQHVVITSLRPIYSIVQTVLLVWFAVVSVLAASAFILGYLTSPASTTVWSILLAFAASEIVAWPMLLAALELDDAHSEQVRLLRQMRFRRLDQTAAIIDQLDRIVDEMDSRPDLPRLFGFVFGWQFVGAVTSISASMWFPFCCSVFEKEICNVDVTLNDSCS